MGENPFIMPCWTGLCSHNFGDQEEKLLNQPCKWLERLLETTDQCLAVLGCRDQPTDAVEEYCRHLAKPS